MATATAVNQLKAAIRREQGFGVGQQAPLFLICGCCGSRVDMGMSMDPTWPKPEKACESCGQTYDASGWILTAGKAVR